MEKKSIGTFIAELRKTSGMTQKELAEMLNVSDKTISHWECNQSSPDLSLIPVIAEIFSIGSDELLSGERNYNNNKSVQIKKNGEKQLNFLLNKNLTALKIKALFCFAVSFVGLIAGTIMNYEKERSMIGFLACGAFSVIAFALTMINDIMYKASLKGIKSEISENCAREYRAKGNSVTARLSYFVITILCFSVSLINWYDLKEIISFGFFYAGIAAVVFLVIDIVLKSSDVIYRKVRQGREKKLFNFSAITFGIAGVLLAGGAVLQYTVCSSYEYAKLGDILSMVCYVYYPLVVILAAIVYAVGIKKIKK